MLAVVAVLMGFLYVQFYVQNIRGEVSDLTVLVQELTNRPTEKIRMKPVNCGFFYTEEDATRFMNLPEIEAGYLDGNGDKIGCEHLP